MIKSTLRAMARTGLFILAVTALVACGGGGGGGANTGTAPPAPDPEPDYGMDSRPLVAELNLPGQIGQPEGFSAEEIFRNLSFSASTFLAPVPGENRLVVLEQGGRVSAFANDPDVALTTVILDLSSRVLFSGEQGLLGLAFDPDFTTNRYLYVHYSMSGPRRSVIARFTWDASSDRADLATEKIILSLEQPAGNHNGGMLAFGPDDMLYVAFGDGGGSGDTYNNGQDPTSLHGNLLRLDVHPTNPADAYDIPPDNPFIGNPGFRDEIWALGLRNPFRFSFDRQNGKLWLGDVGQNAWEEIDLIEKGGNYGWPRFEGNSLFDSGTALTGGLPHSPPLVEYDHSEGRAVIGGYVYRGSQFASLFGHYLYTDNSSGTIWALDYDGVNIRGNQIIAQASGPTSFGEDHAGELYITSGSGIIYQLVRSGGGSLPTTLSETGLFSDLANLVPAPGFIEYDLNIPFWSDGSLKWRWIAVPNAAAIGFSPTGQWGFPEGTVLLKHFEMELVEGDPLSRRRLETRVLVNGENEWFGFTYRWNAQQTDAVLLTGRESEVLSITEIGGGTRQQRYTYPSSADCLACHNPASGFALGLLTRQMNRDFDYPAATDKQLRTWNHIEMFDSDIGDDELYEAYPQPGADSAGLETSARAYLDVNCSQCHRPAGPTSVDIDLRFDTTLSNMGAVNAIPQAGSLGVNDARIISPGNRNNSVLWLRMNSLEDGVRMPPIASHRIDATGVALVGDWIDSL